MLPHVTMPTRKHTSAMHSTASLHGQRNVTRNVKRKHNERIRYFIAKVGLEPAVRAGKETRVDVVDDCTTLDVSRASETARDRQQTRRKKGEGHMSVRCVCDCVCVCVC